MKSELSEATVAQQPEQPAQPVTPDAGRDLDRDRVANKQALMNRRQFMIATGAVAGTVVVGSGTALGESEVVVPDFSSDLTPNPWLEGKYEIAEQKADMGPLGFIDDNSEDDSLANYGAVVAPREDDDPDVDPKPHNWFRFSADGLETSEYTDFPREVVKKDVYDSPDEDEEDDPVSAVDAEHWDDSGGATVEDNDRGVRITGGDGDSAVFDRMETLDSPARRILQLVANVDSIDSGASMDIEAEDSDGNTVSASIDADGDDSDDDIIATETGDGYVLQVEIGELSGGDSLVDIEKITASIAGGTVDATFFAINLDRSSKWSYGTREILDDDDEIDTKTVHEPTGMTGITGPDGLEDDFGDAIRHDVEVDLELRAEELPSDNLDLDVRDVERGDRPKRYELIGNFEIPTGYDLEPDLSAMNGKARHSSSRYFEVGFETGLDEIHDLEDVEDDELNLTDRTSDFEDGDFEDFEEIEFTTTIPSDGYVAFYYDLNVEDATAGEMSQSPGGGGAPAFAESGGLMTDMRGWVLAIVTGILGTAGAIKAGIIGGE